MAVDVSTMRVQEVIELPLRNSNTVILYDEDGPWYGCTRREIHRLMETLRNNYRAKVGRKNYRVRLEELHGGRVRIVALATT